MEIWTTMNSRTAQLNKVAPRHIRAQAAVWVTDLHGPDRNADLEASVRRWIAEDPRHAAAFELATEAWQRSGNLPGSLPNRASGRANDGRRARVSAPVLACAAVMFAAFLLAIYFARDGNLATGPGEQKTIDLSDGTQVSLNANTHIVVQYDRHVRKVTLASGEALFNVIKHQSRPFIVVIGDRKVLAMGTSFLVRRETGSGSAFSVTLMEGRIAVEPIAWPDVLPSDTPAGLKVLNPGERLRFNDESPETLDTPSIAKVTAWRRGQLIFDDISMAEAAAEFNRYGKDEMTIDSAVAAKMRVGGVFRIGDPSSFATAMANRYHLRIINRDHRIILTDR
jgi:transmembrane sensor